MTGQPSFSTHAKSPTKIETRVVVMHVQPQMRHCNHNSINESLPSLHIHDSQSRVFGSDIEQLDQVFQIRY